MYEDIIEKLNNECEIRNYLHEFYASSCVFSFGNRAIPLFVQYMMDNKQDKDKTPGDLMKQFSYL